MVELKITLLHLLLQPNHIRNTILGLGLCLFTYQLNGEELIDVENEAKQSCDIRFAELTDVVRRLDMLEGSELSPRHKLLLIEALPSLHPHDPPLCAYTLTNDSYVSEDLKLEYEFQTTERFTPVGELMQRWSLLRINGRSPTNQDLDLYEMEQNARIREARVAPWQLERNLPLHILGVTENPTDQQQVIFSGYFDFKPDKELDMGEFKVTLTVNLVSRRMEKYTISLQSPIQPNLLSAVSQYELAQDWEFNDIVNRLVRTKTYYKIAGATSDMRFWSEATSTASEFYCPSDTLEQAVDIANPCLEHVDLIPHPLQSREHSDQQPNPATESQNDPAESLPTPHGTRTNQNSDS